MKNLYSLGLRNEANRLSILDQTRLPVEEIWIETPGPEAMIESIKRLAVRGAPLIGVAAAASLGRYAERGVGRDTWLKAAAALRKARPTAVNLMSAVDRMTEGLSEIGASTSEAGGPWTAEAVRRAEAIFDDEVALTDKMCARGAALIQDGDRIITHCNTGGLATVGRGTALGAIKLAVEQGKNVHVYVDETRPLLQGARLTTWELAKSGIPFTLICDNMAGYLMATRRVDRVFVGADRIAANGDFANKIGTYGLAVLARYHQVPFYVVAPETTFDPKCPSGKEIPIELRAQAEVFPPPVGYKCEVWNPAFDVTPRELITGIVMADRQI